MLDALSNGLSEDMSTLYVYRPGVDCWGFRQVYVAWRRKLHDLMFNVRGVAVRGNLNPEMVPRGKLMDSIKARAVTRPEAKDPSFHESDFV
jgi:hypothetical protein